MPDTTTIRFNTTQPADWKLAWEQEAARQGYNLSEWMGLCCNAQLRITVARKLSQRTRAGRPRKTTKG